MHCRSPSEYSQLGYCSEKKENKEEERARRRRRGRRKRREEGRERKKEEKEKKKLFTEEKKGGDWEYTEIYAKKMKEAKENTKNRSPVDIGCPHWALLTSISEPSEK